MRSVEEQVRQLAAQMAAGEASQEAKSDESERKYECEMCEDSGWIPVLETGEEISWRDPRLIGGVEGVRRCKCMVEKQIQRMFGSSHITENFQRIGFKGFVVDGRPKCVREARDTALDYYQRFDEIRKTRHNSIALLGPPGSGKTHLLMAVANGLIRKGVMVQYFPWVEGFNDLKDNLDDLDDRINAMKTVEVLFIDDLYKGRRAPTDFQLEQLFGVVNYRYLNSLPMMVSSEKDVDALFAIDEGIARRIYEMAKGHRVVMGLTAEEQAAGMELNYSLLD
ncbi:MAG: ATP-binding protein [Alicyclobacillus macrosporangiidus]|uniref:ATP-binding protein n=1 Tax=Alicyclobacillus macrosporangiidus TaxID=392015 RepID=UPI0026EFFAF9|nr:ATP-binding protein [Alicyclobacillus macrosporangiidus]MCL6599547.1 ATP-binding protein [Alicyclobacillus macrosporangiidus]